MSVHHKIKMNNIEFPIVIDNILPTKNFFINLGMSLNTLDGLLKIDLILMMDIHGVGIRI